MECLWRTFGVPFSTVAAVALLISQTTPVAGTENALPTSMLQPHAPILVEGDVDFTEANGVVHGRGTLIDPYIIEGWEIRASVSGILIRNTNAFFVVRNVFVHSATEFWNDAILLSNVTNGRIEDSLANGNANGIVLDRVENVVVTSSTISSNGFGLGFRGTNITITRNRIVGNGEGIVSGGGRNVSIKYNVVSDNGEAMYFQGADFDAVVEGNLVSHNVFGVTLRYDVGLGDRISGSPSFTNGSPPVFILHNNFVENQVQAGDGFDGLNAWDGGYPSGGNYWSDYTGNDNCSGILQDACPNPDGIGDRHYVIWGKNQDRYPLMEPYVVPESSSSTSSGPWPWPLLPATGLLITTAAIAIGILWWWRRPREPEVDGASAPSEEQKKGGLDAR